MKKILSKFFKNDLVLIINTIITIAGAFILLLVGQNAMSNDLVKIVCCVVILFAILTFVVYYSYKRHDKNVTKCVIGCVLMTSLMYWFLVISHKGFKPMLVLMTVLALLILITHIIINSDHHSNPSIVFANQIFFIIYIICLIINTVVEIGNKNFISYANIIFVCGCMSTICVETKCDYFREQREKK